MKILRKIFDKLKNLFKKKENIVMLDEGKNNFDENKNNFRKSLKVVVEHISKKRKKVQTHISVGDGLGIDDKISY